MANIKSDADVASATSKRHHFELAATYLQPFCPVLKTFPTGIKCDAIKISAGYLPHLSAPPNSTGHM
eukprot:6192736-Ditylum_brightwellii.AAC.2